MYRLRGKTHIILRLLRQVSAVIASLIEAKYETLLSEMNGRRKETDKSVECLTPSRYVQISGREIRQEC